MKAKKKCGKWRKWREENGETLGEKKNVENGENGEKKMERKMRKEKAEEVEDVHVVLGVDLEEEVLGENSMVWILTLTLQKKLGLLRRLKRRLTL